LAAVAEAALAAADELAGLHELFGTWFTARPEGRQYVKSHSTVVRNR
jgi:hypothetical protein